MELEAARGNEIAWHNAQFYWDWGDLSNTRMYELMMQKGWDLEKLVIGVVTNPENGKGFVPWEMLSPVLEALKSLNQTFGGIMGWEYFNSLPGDIHRPWEWAKNMTINMRGLPSTYDLQSPDEGIVVLES